MSKTFLAAIRAQNKALEVGKERGKRAYENEPNITLREERGKFRRNLTPEEIMLVLNAQEKGIPRAKIAQQTGLKPAAVYNISYRYELTRVGGYKVLGRDD